MSSNKINKKSMGKDPRHNVATIKNPYRLIVHFFKKQKKVLHKLFIIVTLHWLLQGIYRQIAFVYQLF